MRLSVVARGDFAERFRDDAVNVREDARDAERDADVAVRDAGANLLREVLSFGLQTVSRRGRPVNSTFGFGTRSKRSESAVTCAVIERSTGPFCSSVRGV